MKLFFAFLTLFVLISSVSAIVTQTRKSRLSRVQHLHAENLFLQHTLDARATEAAQSLVTKEGDVKYFIFVDAGSGGSRPYLYKSTENKANEAPTVVKVDTCIDNITPTLAQLNSTSDDVSKDGSVAKFYKTIHDECEKKLKAKGINDDINTMNVFVQATAGMRVIEEAVRHAILEKLNSETIHGDIKPRAAVISGRWEGFYGFYNAVAKNLGNTFTKDNFVYVEIGGASIQVVFTVPDDKYSAVKGVSPPAFVETDTQVQEQGVVQPVFLEVEGPMSLSKLPGLQFSKIFSQSFLGDAGDRIHARAVHKCILNNKGKKIFPCPCLTKGANLVPVDGNPKSVAKNKASAGGSPVCFEKSATRDKEGKTFDFKASKCKDYDIPSPFITLEKDEMVEGTGKFAECFPIVESIHSNEKDELKTKAQPAYKPFAAQWNYLKSALDAAEANKKTHVMINSGGFAFSPAFKDKCAKDTEYNFADFKKCLEDSVDLFQPMTEDFILKSDNNATTWAQKNGQGYGVPSVHALVKDILTRLDMYKDKITFKVVFADWTEASSVIAASAQLMPTNDLVSKKAQALYDGADVFGAESENTEVDDNNLATWYEHVHAKLKALGSWISNSFWSLWNRDSSKK